MTRPDLEKNTDNDVYRPPSTESLFPNTDSNLHAIEANYNMIDWFKKGLRNYTNFSGRARRKEYWYFVLVEYIILFIGGLLDAMLFDSEFGLLGFVLTLALFLPSIAVTIRRLHDINRSGWWILLSMIPIIGTIWLFIFLVTETKFESNQWGAPAK